MIRRFSVCAVGLFVAVLVAQPALGAWKLLAVSGNSGSNFPLDYTMASVGVDDENLYELDLETGCATYIRGMRNNVDQVLIADYFWTGPFFGVSYRKGQSIAYNPDDGLLYHRNGTIGSQASLDDPRHYDNRIIETYVPGPDGDFIAAPVKIYNALTGSFFGPTGLIAPDFPIDGNIWSESRGMTWNPRDSNFVIADKDGDIGYWDPTLGDAPDAAVFVRTNTIGHKGVSWYSDGSATGRLFSPVSTTTPAATLVTPSSSWTPSSA